MGEILKFVLDVSNFFVFMCPIKQGIFIRGGYHDLNVFVSGGNSAVNKRNVAINLAKYFLREGINFQYS